MPAQCSVDQDCPSGNVCNFATTPRSCVPGRACTSNADCDICSDINPMQRLDCGQGIYVTATCDAAHGSVCVRGRGLCEPCQTDAECGRLHPIFGGGTKSCVVYPDGNRYCTRPCPNCPDGMVCDSSSNLCTRFSGCGAMPIYCPLNPNPASTCGGGQICEGETCPNTGGARCATNNQPGEIGLCLGVCTQNGDCPPTLPICNLGSGNCIAGCTPASCPSTQVCHADGFCDPPCSTDADCAATEFCNLPGGVGPRAFKSYRDTNACAPLGCERPSDCPGGTCDTTQSPPACI
ncbi:MAG: hypothetical protein RIT81_39905 [Deltaproteobacteria bacterium]